MRYGKKHDLLIKQAMPRIDIPLHCLAMVAKSAGELYGLVGGDYRKAWSQAADKAF